MTPEEAGFMEKSSSFGDGRSVGIGWAGDSANYTFLKYYVSQTSITKNDTAYCHWKYETDLIFFYKRACEIIPNYTTLRTA